jgi:ribosomal protein S27AE
LHTGAYLDGDQITIVDQEAYIRADAEGRIPIRKSQCPRCRATTILATTAEGLVHLSCLLLEADGTLQTEVHECGRDGPLEEDLASDLD